VNISKKLCQDLTKILGAIRNDFAELPQDFLLVDLHESIEKKRQINNLFESAVELLSQDELWLRQRIARKIQVDYVTGFSENRAWAVFGDKSDFRFLVDRFGKQHSGRFFCKEDDIITSMKDGIVWTASRIAPDQDITIPKIENKFAVEAYNDIGMLVHRENVIEANFDSFASNGIISIKRTHRDDYDYIEQFLQCVDGKVKPMFENVDIFADRRVPNAWIFKPGIYDNLSPFSDGVAWVKVDGLARFIDTKGNILGEIPVSGSEYLLQISDGVVWLVSANEEIPSVLYDVAGNKLLTLPAGHYPNRFHGNRAKIQNATNPVNVSYHFIDKTGAQVGGRYVHADTFSEGLAVVQKKFLPNPFGKVKRKPDFGYIKPDGKPAFSDKFFVANAFHEGVAAVSPDNHSYIYINPDGTKAFEGVFQAAESFEDGVAKVREGGEDYSVDHKGRRVFESKWT
jgi:hypothetical protein